MRKKYRCAGQARWGKAAVADMDGRYSKFLFCLKYWLFYPMFPKDG
jgi:hypothetical protein